MFLTRVIFKYPLIIPMQSPSMRLYHRLNNVQTMIVPVCLSASHVALGALRMEAIFMILAQFVATAASLAIEQEVAVQQQLITRVFVNNYSKMVRF